MEKLNAFFSKKLFDIDGIHITLALVVVIAVIYLVFFRRR